MARRYDHTSEQLHRMTLDAARDIVTQEGIRELSTRKVANRIGYSVGTLYNHFKNLDDIIVQMNAETLDALNAEFAALPRSTNPVGDIKTLADTYIAFTRRHQNLWNTLFEHRLPRGETLPDWYQPKVDTLISLLEDRVASEFPDLKALDLRRAASVLWSAVHGICSLSNSDKLTLVSTETSRELSHTLIDTYFSGLRSS